MKEDVGAADKRGKSDQAAGQNEGTVGRSNNLGKPLPESYLPVVRLKII